MTIGGTITDLGKKVFLNRGYKTTPDYSIPAYYKIGVGDTAVSGSDTDLENAIPISNGTVNDPGDNNFTGSGGGDNSTDNTTTYKQGSGLTDNTAQNLIANDTSATKTWLITGLDTNVDSSKYLGLWIYIIDATALAKFKNSGTCLEFRFESDSSNYYSIVKTKSELSTGWNWITTNTEMVSDLTSVGSPGTLSNFRIIATTNNATDEFIAGDLIYDLLRTWEASDLLGTFQTGYPSINETTLKVTTEILLNSLQANGFDLSEIGIFNNDSTKKLIQRDVFTNKSKSNTEEFRFTIINEVV